MLRPLPVVLTTCLFTVLAGCARPAGPATAHETLTFPAAAGKVVRADVGSLDVEIRVAERDDIRAEWWIEAKSSSSAAARRWVAGNTPTFDDSPGTLEIRQGRSRGLFVIGFMNVEGRLQLEIPPTCILDLTTASGDVTLDGPATLTGTVKVRSASGDVEVGGGVRELSVHTASGDVRVDGTPLDLLDVDTASGDVRLEAGAAKVLAETASGDLRLRRLTGDLSADTASGDVYARWDELAPGASLRVSTASGDVALRLLEELSPNGELRTSSGDIRSSFEGTWDRRHKHLTLSGAGPTLTVRTSSGSVSLISSD